MHDVAGANADLARAAPLFARLGRAVRLAGGVALGIVYPPTCIACGAATGEPHTLCADCWSEVRFIEHPLCDRLGTPFAVDLGVPLLSPAAIADPPVFARARAAARYDDVARALVHRLKYGDRPELAQALGLMMARAGRELLADSDVIVPVPLHRWRLWWRRFNQAMLLAAAVVSRVSGVPCDPFLLARVKRLTKNQRGENLQGAFRVPADAKPRLQDKHVLLVDDVVTTGANRQCRLARAPARRG
jgi:ComF family protein